jgi:DNA invertase Pin-like site-specific DNA recombinase
MRIQAEVLQVQKLSSRLGKEVCDEICERYAAGETAGVIAADHDIAKNSVLNLVRSRNIVVRAQGPTEKQIDQAVRLYELGMSIAKIQKEVGSSYGAIRRALLRAKIPMRPRGFQPRPML